METPYPRCTSPIDRKTGTTVSMSSCGRSCRPRRWPPPSGRRSGLSARDGDPIPTVYLPYRQEDWNNGVHVIVRTVVPPAALASAIRKEIRAIGKGWIVEIDTIEGLLAESVAVPRFYLVLVGALAALAMVLAAIGIYGVIGY